MFNEDFLWTRPEGGPCIKLRSPPKLNDARINITSGTSMIYRSREKKKKKFHFLYGSTADLTSQFSKVGKMSKKKVQISCVK